MSSVHEYNVWKWSVVALPAVAPPDTRLTLEVVNATNGPPEPVLHIKSVTGLSVRAGAPGEVFVALHSAVDDRRLSAHEALALIVSVGPVVAFKPASKCAEVGAVSAVEAALNCSITTRPAVMDTSPGRLQDASGPEAVHCPRATDDANVNVAAIVRRNGMAEMVLTGLPVQRERCRRKSSLPG